MDEDPKGISPMRDFEMSCLIPGIDSCNKASKVIMMIIRMAILLTPKDWKIQEKFDVIRINLQTWAPWNITLQQFLPHLQSNIKHYTCLQINIIQTHLLCLHLLIYSQEKESNLTARPTERLIPNIGIPRVATSWSSFILMTCNMTKQSTDLWKMKAEYWLLVTR